MHRIISKKFSTLRFDVAIETPLDLASNLSARVGNKIILKREDMQPVFLQAARRLQQDRQPVAENEARRDLRLGRQSRPGRRPVGQSWAAGR
jgi:hypothetical protein